jgi:predicted phosphodiesterase
LSSEALTISFVGDVQGYYQGQYDDFRTVYEQLLAYAGSVDISIFAGDLVDDSTSYDQWKFLDIAVGDYMASNFVVTPLGNHDDDDGGVVFSNTFITPENGLAWLENRVYYFEIGDLVVSVIDTQSYSDYSNQKEWLIEAMKGYQDKFKIVLMHRSPYPMKYDESYVRTWSETFDQAEIDLVLSGHDHVYSRTTMKNDKKVTLQEGVTYLVGGSSSGSKFYDEEAIEGGRYWKDVVFDDDYPVFSILNLVEGILTVEVYALIDGEAVMIDSFEKE